MNTQARPPMNITVAAAAKVTVKLPVQSSRNPVIAGAIMPAVLAKQFCRPVHFPDAFGPASAWGKAKIPVAAIPHAAKVTNTQRKNQRGPARVQQASAAAA